MLKPGEASKEVPILAALAYQLEEALLQGLEEAILLAIALVSAVL